MKRHTEVSVEKESLEEIQTELCAIRGLAGEIISRIHQLKERVGRLGQAQIQFNLEEAGQDKGTKGAKSE